MYPFVVRKPHTTRGFVGALRRVRISGGVQRLPRLGHRSAARSCTSEPLRARKRAALNGVARTRVLPTQKPCCVGFDSRRKDGLTGPPIASVTSGERQPSGPRAQDRSGLRISLQRALPATALPTVAKPRGRRKVLWHRGQVRPRAEPATVRIPDRSSETGPGNMPRPVAAAVSRAEGREANRYRPATPRRVPPSRPS
jgi:hypothetical protein